MPAPIWWLMALPFVAGACLPLQAGINGQLAKQVSSVLAAALVLVLAFNLLGDGLRDAFDPRSDRQQL